MDATQIDYFEGKPDDHLSRVVETAEKLGAMESSCDSGWAYMGWLLLGVAQMQLWRVKYDSFRAYLRSVSEISRKTPEQLQRYFLTVRDLADVFSRQQLEGIGITKAMRLRQVKDFAVVFPENIIKAALDPGVSARQLKKEIGQTFNLEVDDGDWMDLECEFMVTPEQRALLEQAIDVAMHTEPLTKQTVSKSAQMLDVMTKFAQEFLGAHAGDGQ